MKAVFLIARENFRDEELMVTKARLEEAGIDVMVASDQLGMATGSGGAQVEVDIKYDDSLMGEFDALILVGGSGALVYKGDEKVVALLSEYLRNDKLIGAICIAPTILSETGLFADYKMTVHLSGVDDLQADGIEYVNDLVVEDKNLITANGPEAADEFGRTIAKRLIGGAQRI